jgi:hypothetical protein
MNTYRLFTEMACIDHYFIRDIFESFFNEQFNEITPTIEKYLEEKNYSGLNELKKKYLDPIQLTKLIKNPLIHILLLTGCRRFQKSFFGSSMRVALCPESKKNVVVYDIDHFHKIYSPYPVCQIYVIPSLDFRIVGVSGNRYVIPKKYLVLIEIPSLSKSNYLSRKINDWQIIKHYNIASYFRNFSYCSCLIAMQKYGSLDKYHWTIGYYYKKVTDYLDIQKSCDFNDCDYEIAKTMYINGQSFMFTGTITGDIVMSNLNRKHNKKSCDIYHIVNCLFYNCYDQARLYISKYEDDKDPSTYKYHFVIKALWYASQKGPIDLLHTLLDKNSYYPDVISQAFFHAVRNSQSDKIILLLQRGADVDYWNDSAMRFAIINGNHKIVKLLALNGANINVIYDCNFQNSKKFMRCVRVLEESGFYIDSSKLKI